MFFAIVILNLTNTNLTALPQSSSCWTNETPVDANESSVDANEFSVYTNEFSVVTLVIIFANKELSSYNIVINSSYFFINNQNNKITF